VGTGSTWQPCAAAATLVTFTAWGRGQRDRRVPRPRRLSRSPRGDSVNVTGVCRGRDACHVHRDASWRPTSTDPGPMVAAAAPSYCGSAALGRAQHAWLAGTDFGAQIHPHVSIAVLHVHDRTAGSWCPTHRTRTRSLARAPGWPARSRRLGDGAGDGIAGRGRLALRARDRVQLRHHAEVDREVAVDDERDPAAAGREIEHVRVIRARDHLRPAAVGVLRCDPERDPGQRTELPRDVAGAPPPALVTVTVSVTVFSATAGALPRTVSVLLSVLPLCPAEIVGIDVWPVTPAGTAATVMPVSAPVTVSAAPVRPESRSASSSVWTAEQDPPTTPQKGARGLATAGSFRLRPLPTSSDQAAGRPYGSAGTGRVLPPQMNATIDGRRGGS
jgi:hypothetical protein